MFGWSHVTTREGTLDELLTIKATAGWVEVYGDGWTLRFPSACVNQLIRRLEAARDAAAIMNSGK